MTEREEELLMKHVDGELEPSEADSVRRLLAESGEARALVRDFERVGHLVRAVADERGRAADGIADQVFARLPEPEPAPRRARVVALAPVAALALAAAAAVALLVRPVPRTSVPVAEPSAQEVAVLPSVLAPAPADEDPAEGDTGAAIESVDFGAQNGSIFMVASGPQVTPVVWLSDDDESGGRMQPL
ncbi:MAG TPA: hypothetical protein VHE30_18425 [Polyangiaceae bacterium]|nr:hypothetical protein [Polyangiaceae bacterium]